MIVDKRDINWEGLGCIASGQTFRCDWRDGGKEALDQACHRVAKLKQQDELVCNVQVLRECGHWHVSWWRLQPYKA